MQKSLKKNSRHLQTFKNILEFFYIKIIKNIKINYLTHNTTYDCNLNECHIIDACIQSCIWKTALYEITVLPMRSVMNAIAIVEVVDTHAMPILSCSIFQYWTRYRDIIESRADSLRKRAWLEIINWARARQIDGWVDKQSVSLPFVYSCVHKFSDTFVMLW